MDRPVVQILAMKQLPIDSSDDPRFHLSISDGKYHYAGVLLSPNLNRDAAKGQLPDLTIVRIATQVHGNAGRTNRNVIMIFVLEVLHPGPEVGVRIGNPRSIKGFFAVNEPAPKRMRIDEGSFEGPTHPINSLSPNQSKWPIRARVTSKTQIYTRRTSNSRFKILYLWSR